MLSCSPKKVGMCKIVCHAGGNVKRREGVWCGRQWMSAYSVTGQASRSCLSSASMSFSSLFYHRGQYPCPSNHKRQRNHGFEIGQTLAESSVIGIHLLFHLAQIGVGDLVERIISATTQVVDSFATCIGKTGNIRFMDERKEKSQKARPTRVASPSSGETWLASIPTRRWTGKQVVLVVSKYVL